MGNGAPRVERDAAAFASGQPKDLDWPALIGGVFRAANQAVLVVTSDAEVGAQAGQPFKVIDCIRAGSVADGADAAADLPPAVAVPFDSALLDGRVGVVSQKGRKSAPNQDAAFYLEFIDGDGARVWMACAMDGHGPLGHDMSRLVMQWLPLLVLRDPAMTAENGKGRLVPTDPLAVFEGVSAAFAKLGALLSRASSGSLDREMSGTTCVFVLCARGLLHSANVGDSRAVLGAVRAEPGASAFSLKVDVRCLTRDHKPEDVEERRRLEAKGGFVNGQRVWLSEWPFVGLNMSRSLGDSLVHAVGVSDVPDVATTFLDETFLDEDATVAGETPSASAAGANGSASASSSASSSTPAATQAASAPSNAGFQFLLLASDGVWEFMSNDDATTCVAAQLQEADRDPATQGLAAAQTSAQRLTARATSRWREETDAELDDITAVVVRI